MAQTVDGRPIMVQDRYEGDDGPYLFTRPSVTTKEDLDDVLAWMELLKRRIIRSVSTAAPQMEREPDGK